MKNQSLTEKYNLNDDTILTANDGSGDTITYGELSRYMNFWATVLVVSSVISVLCAAAAMLIS